MPKKPLFRDHRTSRNNSETAIKVAYPEYFRKKAEIMNANADRISNKKDYDPLFTVEKHE